MIATENKTCTTCKIPKSLVSFNKEPKGRLGVKSKCKPCEKQYRLSHRKQGNKSIASWRSRNPERFKSIELKGKYGITLEQYNSILRSQNGVCAICCRPEKSHDHRGKLRDLSVDHCHQTGKIRGLLCFDCNTALGKFNEDVEVIASACEYLERDFISYG